MTGCGYTIVIDISPRKTYLFFSEDVEKNRKKEGYWEISSAHTFKAVKEQYQNYKLQRSYFLPVKLQNYFVQIVKA